MSNSLPGRGVKYSAPVRLLQAASVLTQPPATPSFNDVSPVLKERSCFTCIGASPDSKPPVMLMGGEISESEILIIRNWINQGAPGNGQPEAAVVEAGFRIPR